LFDFSKDDILLEQLKKGNEKAYKHLYDAFYKDLVIYCLNLTHNLEQAKDIVQNTLINFWTRREHLNITISLKSYLYRSVFNNFSTQFKKKKKEEETLIKLKNEALFSVIEANEDLENEKMKLLESCIDQLPKKCKKVFLMHKKQGYKYREIAAELNISEKAVEKNISRAIRRIKDAIQLKNKNLLFLLLKKLLKRK